MAKQPLTGGGGGSDSEGGIVYSGHCCGFTALDFSDIALCLQMEQEVW